MSENYIMVDEQYKTAVGVQRFRQKFQAVMIRVNEYGERIQWCTRKFGRNEKTLPVAIDLGDTAQDAIGVLTALAGMIEAGDLFEETKKDKDDSPPF